MPIISKPITPSVDGIIQRAGQTQKILKSLDGRLALKLREKDYIANRALIS